MSNPAEKRKIFLQSFLSRGILNAKQVKELLTKCGVQTDSKEEMAKYVQNANTAIAPFNLEIKKGIQEEDGASFYCLINSELGVGGVTICQMVNTVETSISKTLSIYSDNELELFKKVIEQIVESEDGKIGSLAALCLTEKLEKRMGKEEAQTFFDRLARDMWINKGTDGKISLSVRSIVELDQYLKDMYPDLVKMCNICSKICLMGENCESCGIRIHKKCAQTLFENRAEKRCPNTGCRSLWLEAE